jgi:UDP-N-acetylmuramate dehydrogenase
MGRAAGEPVYVLGRGANLLVADRGVGGVVVVLDDPFFTRVSVEGGTVLAGAGADLPRLVLDTAKRGLAGLEGLAGIPATLGGAVRMNAGGAFGSIGQVVAAVTVVESDGTVRTLDRDELVFSYRSSSIAAPCIADVRLELAEDDADSLGRRIKEIFLFKKTTQPLAENSAGCAFKNPVDPAVDANDYGGPLPRVSAGKLIDQAGLKGFRSGGAQVSTHHANFITTHPGCTAGDVLAVMDHVADVVFQKYGIRLQREVVVWP